MSVIERLATEHQQQLKEKIEPTYEEKLLKLDNKISNIEERISNIETLVLKLLGEKNRPLIGQEQDGVK